jgi:putative hemolysin
MFSASEIAVFSLSRVQLRKIKEQSETLFNRLRMLIQDSMGFLITILLFNEVVNIALAAIITSHVVQPLELGPKLEVLVGVLVTTPIILIFCELTPKILASRVNHLVVKVFSAPVYYVYRFTRPIVGIIRYFLRETPIKEMHHLHEEDFLILAEEHIETGHLHETELELIKNVFEMDDTRIEQLAIPMKRVITIPSSYTLEQAAQILLKDKIYSRIPISGKFKEDIVGVLNTKDLVEVKLNPDLRTENVMTLAKEPYMVASHLTTEAVFRKMKSKKVHVAFVKNSLGRITGMVSLQDILATIIEEAFEE